MNKRRREDEWEGENERWKDSVKRRILLTSHNQGAEKHQMVLLSKTISPQILGSLFDKASLKISFSFHSLVVS